MANSEKPLNRVGVRHEAQRLRASVAWDPKAVLGKRETADEQWAQMEQASRHGGVYAEASGCEACTQEQTERHDDTALCERHLMKAMGLGG